LAARLFLDDGERRFVERIPQLVVAQTGSSETPLPAEISPTMLLDLGTLAHAFPASDIGDLVKSATAYAHALTVIPIDPEIDARVEAMMASRVAGIRNKRPLRRP
jgi:hypothetical protein